MKIRVIETNGISIIRDITGSSDKTDFEVLYRFWVKSDGVDIREWSPHEYITQNPKEKIILNTEIDGSGVNVEAHCLECRKVYAHKNGRRVASFINIIDYSKR